LSERKQSLSIRCPLDVVLVRENSGPSRAITASAPTQRPLGGF
jgi:hypothetical protein